MKVWTSLWITDHSPSNPVLVHLSREAAEDAIRLEFETLITNYELENPQTEDLAELADHVTNQFDHAIDWDIQEHLI